MSLQDKLDAFKADFEGKKAPPEVVAVMHKATADLIASGQAERTLKVGARAPIFGLPNAQGELVRSGRSSGPRPIGADLLSWHLVPLLQHGFAGDRSRRRRNTRAWRFPGRDLAADRAEPPQVGARTR